METCEKDARCQTPGIEHVASEAFGLITRWASESASEGRKDQRVVPTGFLNVDKHIWGLYPGELTVITGAPGTGKSSFALNLASRAVVMGFGVLLVSLEASAIMTFIRMCAGDARFEISKIIRGRVSENGWVAIAEAFARLGKPNLRIIDDPQLTREELRADIQQLSKESSGALVIIDGIELASDFGAIDGRPLPIRERAIELKRLAREAGTHVVATMDYGPGSRHKVSDCEGAIKSLPNGVEGVADTIMHIGSLTTEQPSKAPSTRTAEVIIAKSRLCAPARTKLAFLPECLKFMDHVDL